MRHIVADVAKNTTTVHSRGSVPVIEEDGVGEVPERRSEKYEERGRHDQAQPVHGKVMVDTVKQEVQRDGHTIVGKMIIKMEEAAVHAILDQSPDAKPSDPISGKGNCTQALRSEIGAICDRRHPDRGNNPPWSLAQRFQKIAEQRSRFASLVMARPVDLLEIEFLAETTIEDLHQKGLVQVEEFVLSVVIRGIRLFVQVLFRRHAGSGVDRASLSTRINTITVQFIHALFGWGLDDDIGR